MLLEALRCHETNAGSQSRAVRDGANCGVGLYRDREPTRFDLLELNRLVEVTQEQAAELSVKTKTLKPHQDLLNLNGLALHLAKSIIRKRTEPARHSYCHCRKLRAPDRGKLGRQGKHAVNCYHPVDSIVSPCVLDHSKQALPRDSNVSFSTQSSK